MKFSKLAIENHQFTIIIIVLFLISGLISLLNMPRSEDPLVTPAGSSIVVIYPGANPLDMEELIIDPVEEALNELEDIKTINSNAEDGLAVIGIEFEAGSDPDEKYSDVVQKVNSIRNDLPENIFSLDITKWSISDVNILQVALVSETASYRELEEEAENLRKSLEKIGGVKKAEMWAYPEQEIRVSLDLQKMAQKRIALNQVMGAIQGANQNIPGGNVDIGTKRLNIKTSGSYENISDIRNTVVNARQGKVTYLKDLADVRYDYEDLKYRAHFNGKRSVFVTASQKEGTNIFKVEGNIQKVLSESGERLPQSISLHTVFDQAESVANRVNGFFINLLQGLILVGGVVLLAVGLRASVIVMIAIPTSILFAISLIDLSNYGLQQMTIAGLVIALGLLVDNAIVVTENISRFIGRGYSNKDAAVEGTSQISWAIVSSTLTTVLAFIPMMMIGDVTGDFIRSMPVTVVYTLLASLFISLTLTPFLASKYLKRNGKTNGGRLRRFLDRFIESKYRHRLDHALAHPKRYLAIALMVFFASLALFPLVGISFFPKAEKPQFIININTPEGTSLDRTAEIAGLVESILAREKNIKHFATNIGQGNPRIYYNVVPQHEKSNHAQILAELDQYQRKSFNRLINGLREKLSGYPGAEIEVKEFEQGPPINAPVEIRILGENLDMLKKISQDIEKIILETPGTINIRNPIRTSKMDLHVNINRDKAAMLGIPLVEIDRSVRAAMAGLAVSQYRDAEGKDYDIVVRLPFNRKPSVLQFDQIYVSSLSGAMVPLKQIAELNFKASPMQIDHYNLDRDVTLTADVLAQYNVGNVTSQVLTKLENYQWPKGYRYSVGGEQESRQESFGGMLQAVLIAVIAIFAVLVLQFRSYSQPLIVFSAIPLAIVGSVIALLITGYTFSFTAFIGLTSLVGIVVNNSIILVDYTNQLRATGTDMISALKEAGETRFIPIILTTATTIGGLLPLTLGGGTLWAPMGWTIIGGLIMSTILTLIIVPVLFKSFTKTEAGF
jgi:multidrug efflux pump subunit AcrB